MRVPAKVNLALNVGATDNEGYHALGTLFQAVSLFDDLVARPAEAGVFRVSFRGEGASGLPTDDTNLVVRAARLLAGTCGTGNLGAEIRVHKRIPVAGGMAGGSADAAATLVACNQLWGTGLDTEQLHAVAARLGADVPPAARRHRRRHRARGKAEVRAGAGQLPLGAGTEPSWSVHPSGVPGV